MVKIHMLPLMIIFLLLSTSNVLASNDTESTTNMSMNNTVFYQGRIDTTDTNAPVLIWQGSTVETEFTGKDLQIGFKNLTGTVFFNLEIDGKLAKIKAKNGWVQNPIQLDEGAHQVRLFKRTEADVGHVAFTGFKVSHQGEESIIFNSPKTDADNPHHYRQKFLFFGDSITVGACNEDGAEDQWEDYSTHNNALSYATLTANAFNADYRNIAFSGMGISEGYNTLLFKDIWNRIYPSLDSQKADLSSWQPDTIFIMYGENDDSFTTNNGSEFPKNFAKDYISVVEDIRQAYPDSTIVIMRGGMYGGAQSLRLRQPWEQVITTLEAKDNNIKHFVFNHWSELHPRVSDHQAMANELIAWIEENLQ